MTATPIREDALAALSDGELLALIDALTKDDPSLPLALGEAERRGIGG